MSGDDVIFGAEVTDRDSRLYFRSEKRLPTRPKFYRNVTLLTNTQKIKPSLWVTLTHAPMYPKTTTLPL